LRKLKGIVFTKDSLSTIKFDYIKPIFRAEKEEYYIPIAIQVELSQLSFLKKEDKYIDELNFYISILKGGNSVYEGSDRLEMNLSENTYRQLKGQTYQYHHSVSLPPGDYLLKIVLMDGNSSEVGYSEEFLKLPPLSSGNYLSDIIIAESVKTVEQKEEKISSSELEALKAVPKLKVPEKISITSNRAPFVFQNLFVVPNLKNIVRKNVELIFFYQIYPESIGTKLKIENIIEKNGKNIAMAGEPQIFEIKDLTPINNGAKMPLTSLEKGAYTLKVIATDLVSGKKVEKSVTFNVI